MNFARASLVIGAVVAGALVLLSIVALVGSNPRWDDHLINAAGVFLAALFVSVALRLTSAVFRPRPGTSRRTRVVTIVGFIALVLLIVIVVQVALFIDNMSFL